MQVRRHRVPHAACLQEGYAEQQLRRLLVRESFADTTNPGYFLVKLALWLLAGLMLAQGLVDLLSPSRESRT